MLFYSLTRVLFTSPRCSCIFLPSRSPGYSTFSTGNSQYYVHCSNGQKVLGTHKCMKREGEGAQATIMMAEERRGQGGTLQDMFKGGSHIINLEWVATFIGDMCSFPVMSVYILLDRWALPGESGICSQWNLQQLAPRGGIPYLIQSDRSRARPAVGVQPGSCLGVDVNWRRTWSNEGDHVSV